MRLRSLPSIVVLLLVAASCGGRREVVQRPASSSSAVVVVSSPQAQPGSSSQASASGQCQLTLAVGPIRVRPGCTIDERVSGQTAVLGYPCGGGPATVAFGGTTFVGAVTGGEIDVSTETTFPFSDGCQWRTKQRIAGPLGAGSLAYTYEERPDPGQRGCAAGCDASAAVQVR